MAQSLVNSPGMNSNLRSLSGLANERGRVLPLLRQEVDAGTLSRIAARNYANPSALRIRVNQVTNAPGTNVKDGPREIMSDTG